MNDPSSLHSDATSQSSSGPEQGSHAADPDLAGLSREELPSALFAQLVIQQSNLAMMMMGKGPYPEGSGAARNLEAAKLFIDQLEVLEVKTRGNLNRHEETLLKQNLMALRMAFVEAVEAGLTTPPAPASPATTPASAAENRAAPAEGTGAAGEEEPRKKYSKKFPL